MCRPFARKVVSGRSGWNGDQWWFMVMVAVLINLRLEPMKHQDYKDGENVMTEADHESNSQSQEHPQVHEAARV